MMKQQIISGIIGAAIGGIITGLIMHFVFQKPELEKQRILVLADRVHKTLSETINNTQNGNEYVKEFVANELNSDIYELMAYYDETQDCDIGIKIKNYLNTLINMTNDSTKKSKWKEKIEIIDQNCKK